MTASHSSVYEVFDALRALLDGRAFRPASRRPRALVVDDDEATRRFVNRVLRDGGYDTAVAGDGLDALAVAEQFQPVDILVTDLAMPAMNGDELARRMRKQEPALKVLYLTGFSDRLFEDRPCLWEDEAFLDKPCKASALVQAVSLLACGQLHLPNQMPPVTPPESHDELSPAA